MAKLLKIRVLVFSLGFGPKLIGFTRGETEYRLSPFPLGGYVKMAGETYEADREGAPDEFLSHPRWHRFLVAVSGPFMNIFLAVFIMAFSFYQGVQVAEYPNGPAIVGPVVANSIAKRAGLQAGDRILSVHGNPVTTWEEMEIALATAPRDSLDIEVLRDDREQTIHFDNPKDADVVEPEALGFLFSIPKTIVRPSTAVPLPIRPDCRREIKFFPYAAMEKPAIITTRFGVLFPKAKESRWTLRYFVPNRALNLTPGQPQEMNCPGRSLN